MAMRQFKAESKKLLDLMINSIYTNREIFLRELISNASDACDKRYFKSLTDTSVGITKDDLKIHIQPDKDSRTLTITDASVLDNIEFNQGDIDLSKMEHLVITADNASIPNFAFRNNALLKSVCVTGENITVGSYAFYKCTNLDTVLLLGEVSSIGGYAFCNCTSLRALEFTGGDGTEIKSLAFRGCTALQSMVYSGLIAPTFAIDCFSQIPDARCKLPR